MSTLVYFRRVLTLLPFIFLMACSSAPERVANPLLLPMLSGPVDPSDSAARMAITDFLKKSNAPLSSRYDLRRIDLNEDGRRDALVMLTNPYGYWCGIHGCTMLILKASDTDFTLVNAIQPLREPLYVSDTTTNGWKNLIARVSGRQDKARDVAMMFNGISYPQTPSNLPRYTRYSSAPEKRLFYD